MLFPSYEFILLFLPVVLAIYFLIGRFAKARFAIVWLVLSSLFFYSWWNPKYLILIIGSIVCNYVLGLVLQRRCSRAVPLTKKLTLWFGLILNLSFLGYFKYTNLFIETYSALTGGPWALKSIVLPLAISFFTFQQIAYLVDSYKGLVSKVTFLRYALFVSFFPQLIAGPIVHHSEMMPQFEKVRAFQFCYSQLSIGLSLFVVGLFKKVVLADNIAIFANPGFSAAAEGVSLSLFEAWCAALSYTFQIYFDFSGYSDMAIGLGCCFGIVIPLNFNSPYKATNIIEFWRRWHITLSRFLRDYLYIPLGGNRRGGPRRFINIMVTMLLGGLWHGASWVFVLWGGMHGFFIVICHLWHHIKKRFKHEGWSQKSLGRVVGIGLTFLCTVFAWVFFRAESFPAALLVIRGMLGLEGSLFPHSVLYQLGPLGGFLQSLGLESGNLKYFYGTESLAWLTAMFGIVFFAPNSQELIPQSRILDPKACGKMSWQPNYIWLTIISVLSLFSLFQFGKVSDFLYFQF